VKTLSLIHQVRTPLPAPTAGKPPLLVLSHGIARDERSMMAFWDSFDPRFLTISVRSPIELKPGSFAWFHARVTPEGPIIDGDEAEAGWEHLIGFVDEAVHAYEADPTRVFLGGFSQGAIISLAALLTAPERIAGVVVMSGRVLPEVFPSIVSRDRLLGRPVVLIHGTADERLGIEYARTARSLLGPLGIALAYHELEIGHAISDEGIALASAWLTAQLDAASR
jgi:phospholipase/carboxylesterase